MFRGPVRGESNHERERPKFDCEEECSADARQAGDDSKWAGGLILQYRALLQATLCCTEREDFPEPVEVVAKVDCDGGLSVPHFLHLRPCERSGQEGQRNDN